jgi:hypothetical protein
LAGIFGGAYYLCGYVIECALKACIAKKTQRYDFPPDQKTVRDIYTHDLGKLVKAAGLDSDLEKEIRSDPDFETNWILVANWSEESRYQKWTEQKARDLYSAITDRKHGVLRWVKRHW